ncbi:MAG: cation:proton antiporter [Propionibacteriaceae bacterium]|nr:cation:proton antiporter [Propionibacteriaceae bacterium]
MEYMVLIFVVVAAVVALSTVSDRLGVAPPLILMLVGVGISFLPMVSIGPIDPEWILAVILPPLLYVGAISIPTVELRRDFSAVGGLAILLVVVSAIVLGFIIHWILPGVSLPLGIALGAILSPTDAAATTIVKRLGVPGRVGTILQGESLLNDATALVLLRSAIAAAGATVSMWHIVGDFLWAAGAAVVIGMVVGWAGVRVRRLVRDPAPATAISFLLPFVAYFPAELLHASGLVSVVAAGIVASQIGPKHLDARQRISERENWHTFEFLLEGAVFLGMGLELSGLVMDVYGGDATLWRAAGIAALAILVTQLVRGGYVTILLKAQEADIARKTRRGERWRHVRSTLDSPPQTPSPRQEALLNRRDSLRERLDGADPATQARVQDRVAQFRSRVKRYLADVDYLIDQPLGAKEGWLLTWAGMRGVVTLAAAQTLPVITPHRSLLILIAFFVAAGSLVIQGGTLPWLVRVLRLDGQDTLPEGELDRLTAELDEAVDQWQAPSSESASDAELALARLRVRRQALIDLRSTGAYGSRAMSVAWAGLDAEEIGIQIRLSGE